MPFQMPRYIRGIFYGYCCDRKLFQHLFVILFASQCCGLPPVLFTQKSAESTCNLDIPNQFVNPAGSLLVHQRSHAAQSQQLRILCHRLLSRLQ